MHARLLLIPLLLSGALKYAPNDLRPVGGLQLQTIPSGIGVGFGMGYFFDKTVMFSIGVRL